MDARHAERPSAKVGYTGGARTWADSLRIYQQQRKNPAVKVLERPKIVTNKMVKAEEAKRNPVVHPRELVSEEEKRQELNSRYDRMVAHTCGFNPVTWKPLARNPPPKQASAKQFAPYDSRLRFNPVTGIDYADASAVRPEMRPPPSTPPALPRARVYAHGHTSQQASGADWNAPLREPPPRPAIRTHPMKNRCSEDWM